MVAREKPSRTGALGVHPEWSHEGGSRRLPAPSLPLAPASSVTSSILQGGQGDTACPRATPRRPVWVWMELPAFLAPP